jgi:hypothetical protein
MEYTPPTCAGNPAAAGLAQHRSRLAQPEAQLSKHSLTLPYFQTGPILLVDPDTQSFDVPKDLPISTSRGAQHRIGDGSSVTLSRKNRRYLVYAIICVADVHQKKLQMAQRVIDYSKAQTALELSNRG